MRAKTDSVAEAMDKAKASELAADSGLIERLRAALDEVRQGKTVSLDDLPNTIARRKSRAKAAQA